MIQPLLSLALFHRLLLLVFVCLVVLFGWFLSVCFFFSFRASHNYRWKNKEIKPCHTSFGKHKSNFRPKPKLSKKLETSKQTSVKILCILSPWLEDAGFQDAVGKQCFSVILTFTIHQQPYSSYQYSIYNSKLKRYAMLKSEDTPLLGDELNTNHFL